MACQGPFYLSARVGCGEPTCRRDSVPGTIVPGGGHPSMRPTWGHRTGSPSHAWPCSGWGLPSRPGHPGRWCALAAPFHPCLCLAAIGGLLSVALSFGSPRLAVNQHPALRSPDLPRTRCGAPCPRPPGRLAADAIVAPGAYERRRAGSPRRRWSPRVAFITWCPTAWPRSSASISRPTGPRPGAPAPS